MTLLVSERSLMIRNKFRSVLQLRLQHRRTREQLAEQGIVTPLKGPSAFIDQQRSLERAKTEDFLKHKIRSRPERTDLVKMNILEDAVANPTQMKQKKARLAHNLNEKILHRPGPLELVEKNILPLNSSVKEAMKVGQIHLRQPSDPSPFEDDSSSSSNSSSPEQPGSHQSQSTAGSPQQPTDQPITSSSAPLQGPLAMPQRVQLHAAIPELVAESNATATSGHGNGQLVPVAPLATGLPRASESSKPQRHKKPKEPKVKKLKYHQYIPPDQKAEKCPVAMDAAYSRLLQQQQIFLQLQILNQQQHQQAVSYQTIQPGTAGLPPDHIIGFASAVPNPVPCVPLSTMTKSCQRASIVASAKPELLPANLDDLTVSELRQQLRKRGLPVSGTKPALLERLKPYQIASPKPAPLSLAQLPPAAAAPATGAKEEVSLVEKEKVIERLTWKLQQEQRQAEDLRLELERRKRRQRHQAQRPRACTPLLPLLRSPASSSPHPGSPWRPAGTPTPRRR
ncbi:myocardin-like isoform X2 [Heptranchias perlo]|uniref:myocardin-like isoform X2 n=1 Tax=Heptranchias perlo TaxID=212740 RepID=UPI00355A5CAB